MDCIVEFVKERINDGRKKEKDSLNCGYSY